MCPASYGRYPKQSGECTCVQPLMITLPSSQDTVYLYNPLHPLYHLRGRGHLKEWNNDQKEQSGHILTGGDSYRRKQSGSFPDRMG